MIQLISITGTESTGKTELAGELATHYKTVFVPDYSRQYVAKLERKYNHSDVVAIAKEIIEEERKKLQYGHRILFSDNDLINIKIWLRYYKWHVPDWLEAEIVKRKNNLHLLCDIDIAWIPDEQRKNKDDRELLFKRFKEELDSIGASYKIISGKNSKRVENAIEAIDGFLALAK
ncbi:MAG: ATP-binding protein [Bacteroidota bacterium]